MSKIKPKECQDAEFKAHPINLGDSQDLPGRQYTSALPM